MEADIKETHLRIMSKEAYCPDSTFSKAATAFLDTVIAKFLDPYLVTKVAFLYPFPAIKDSFQEFLQVIAYLPCSRIILVIIKAFQHTIEDIEDSFNHNLEEFN